VRFALTTLTIGCWTLLASGAGAAAAPAPGQGPRVVDVVTVGDVRSERAHEFAGEGVMDGAAGGRAFRQTSGWQRYSLSVFDDTEVTIVCTFRGSEGSKLAFDLVVEGRTIVSRTFVTPDAKPTSVALRVPADVTRGRTVIAVTLRSSSGPTPGLMEIRSVQEHLELW